MSNRVNRGAAPIIFNSLDSGGLSVQKKETALVIKALQGGNVISSVDTKVSACPQQEGRDECTRKAEKERLQETV